MSLVIEMESTDVLTEVLSTLGIQGRVFCCSELSAPWSMALPASGMAHFHVLEQGDAWIRLEVQAKPYIRPVEQLSFSHQQSRLEAELRWHDLVIAELPTARPHPSSQPGGQP